MDGVERVAILSKKRKGTSIDGCRTVQTREEQDDFLFFFFWSEAQQTQNAPFQCSWGEKKIEENRRRVLGASRRSV